MKQITELTEQEILQLTDDQLSNMVKFKMAESGIKILDRPIEPNYEKLPKKEVEVFKVKGIDNLFINKATAEKIGDILKDHKEEMISTSYFTTDYNYSFPNPYSDVNYSFNNYGKVEEMFLYNKETVLRIKDDVAINVELKTKYEADLREYNEAEEASSDIKSVIYGTYNDVVKKYHRMAEMQYHYQQYVKLADGNEETAMKFLKNAYSIDEQTEYYVQGKDMPAEDEAGYETTDKSEGGAN